MIISNVELELSTGSLGCRMDVAPGPLSQLKLELIKIKPFSLQSEFRSDSAELMNTLTE